jgi:phenylacetate-CoA ligase
MTDYLDSLETRDPQQRERDLMARLPELVARAQAAPGWARILNGVNASDITSRAALAQLPVTRKSDLKDLQQADAPFGGLTTTPVRQLRHLFMSPGPIFDPEGQGRRSACALGTLSRTAFPTISRPRPSWPRGARRRSAAR